MPESSWQRRSWQTRPAQTFIFLRQSSCYDWQLLRASDDRLGFVRNIGTKVAVR
jgi:hypothetical protein